MKEKTFLYIIRCDNTDLYKIGVSNSPNYRLSILQVGCPYPLIIIWKGSFKHPYKIENFLHKFYWNNRKIGEWYKLSTSQINTMLQNLDILKENKNYYKNKKINKFFGKSLIFSIFHRDS